MEWKINPEALEEAREMLGLTYPVRVRVIENVMLGMAGKYSGIGHWGPTTSERLEEPAHHITLKASLSPFMANTCLWHEMYHAAQEERYLPEAMNGNGRAPYQVANKALRMAFGEEMREIRARRGISPVGGLTMDYGDVSFEVEAREVMKEMDDFEIIEPTEEWYRLPKENKKDKEDDPLRGYRAKWRVDVYDSKDNFVATQYVLANDEYKAKTFARDKWLKGETWSSNVEVYICPEGGE